MTDLNALAAKAWEDAERAGEDAYIEAVQTGVASSDMAMAKGAAAATAAIAAVIAPELERLSVAVTAAEQRAAQSEHRLYAFRQSRASTSKALSEFIRARAPDLWPDYAAVYANKSVYSDDYTQEPTWEREMNILRYRAEKAEEELTKARTALGASHDADA